MKRRIVVDGRCLQLPGGARRGIGQHIATMLGVPAARAYEIVLYFDPAMPMPAPALLRLGDGAVTTLYEFSREPCLFLQPAPMWLPPGPVLRMLRSATAISVAIVLDFIPHDFPDLYLREVGVRRAYFRCLAALRHYRHFLPISCATEARLHALLPVSRGRSDVTGVAVRSSLVRTGPAPGFADRDGVLVVAGDDPRKNPEIVLRACPGAKIRIAGIHEPARQAALRTIHRMAGGKGDDLEFLPHLPEAGLAEAYARARVLVAPSRAEGFSMPIVEAMAQGTPVLAADEPAQAELVAAEDRFAPADAAALRARLSGLLDDAGAWEAAQRRQAPCLRDFTEAAVGERFWSAIGRLRPAAPAIGRGARPRIAVLTPLPPVRSGCADHSFSLLAALAPRAEVTAFSDTAIPVLPDGLRSGGRADPTVMRSSRFDAVLAVLGNSEFHRTEMRLLLDHGAAAILHDSRMMGFYRGVIGRGAALGVAAAECGREVGTAELDAWERDQGAMPARFLGEIAAAAAPLVIHAAETAEFIARRHGARACFLPFPAYRLPAAESLTAAGRARARTRLDLAPGERLVVSFGHVDGVKDPFRTVEAFGHLASSWHCRFVFAGACNPALLAPLRRHAAACGIAPDALFLGSEPVSEQAYRDYLAAADVAVQLRRATPGSISGALMDAVAAGLPAVADAVLTEALAPPSYVAAISDGAEAAAIGAAIAAAIERGREGTAAERAVFVAMRGMDRYAALLTDAILG